MIGIFGGSGFYSLLKDAEIVDLDTPFGKPSSPITVGTIGGKEVAFMARHGLNHEFPPHHIPYKANIHAFRELGVTRIIAPTAVGSLKKEIEPGHFLIPDQFMNFTRREDTFYEERPVTHINSSEPYCPELRKIIIDTAKKNNLPLHENGTVVVIEGPRFSSGAENEFFRRNSWDIINMTQYPEIVLAREMEICYSNISIITDYDAGMKNMPGIKSVTLEDVIRVFQENNEKLKNLIFDIVPQIPEERTCVCFNALRDSRFN